MTDVVSAPPIEDVSRSLVSPIAPAVSPLKARLGIIRGDIVVELNVLAGLLEIANIFVGLGKDDELARTMGQLRDHLRRGLALVGHLQREARNAEAAGEAAVEWRANRCGRRA